MRGRTMIRSFICCPLLDDATHRYVQRNNREEKARKFERLIEPLTELPAERSDKVRYIIPYHPDIQTGLLGQTETSGRNSL